MVATVSLTRSRRFFEANVVLGNKFHELLSGMSDHTVGIFAVSLINLPDAQRPDHLDSRAAVRCERVRYRDHLA